MYTHNNHIPCVVVDNARITHIHIHTCLHTYIHGLQVPTCVSSSVCFCACVCAPPQFDDLHNLQHVDQGGNSAIYTATYKGQTVCVKVCVCVCVCVAQNTLRAD
jgi:hypothetical protein